MFAPLPLMFALGTVAGLGLLLATGDAQAQQISGYHPPTPGRARVSSEYGWRIDPLTGARSWHDGFDLAVPQGTPVLAPSWGQVNLIHYAGVGPGVYNGNAVFVRTRDGRLWADLHLHGLAVTQGATVRPGQLLGWVGSTGRSTGPHLHRQVWDIDGQTIDPRRLYPPGAFA